MKLISRFCVSAVTLGISFCFFPVSANEFITVGGLPLQWERQEEHPVITYTYVKGPTHFPGFKSGKCKHTESIERLLQRSKLSFSEFHTQVEAAFREWEKLGYLRYQYVEDEKKANVLIGVQRKPYKIAFANLTVSLSPVDGFLPIKQGIICYNPLLTWSTKPGGSEEAPSLYYVTLHEIGHINGLDHPGGKRRSIMGYRYRGDDPVITEQDRKAFRSLYRTK